VHIHKENAIFTSDNLKEDIILLRQTRGGNIKVRGLPATKRTFKPRVLALISREGFGVKTGQEGNIKVLRVAYL
jgi:hypothetical protein